MNFSNQKYFNSSSGYGYSVYDVSPTMGGDPIPIKVVDHPGVYLVAATSLHEGGVNEFLRDQGITEFNPFGDPHGDKCGRNARGQDAELLIELGGRLCYMSYDKPRPGGLTAFIDNLKEEGHGSVFEHAHYTFILSGVSRNMTMEANRHRPLSISQLSGRYTDHKECGFVADPNVMLDPVKRLMPWVQHCADCVAMADDEYSANMEALLKNYLKDAPLKEANLTKKMERQMKKAARERARDVLPGCLETKVMYTMNARAARFIMEKRCHPHAAFEIRRCFNQIFRVLQRHDPLLFSDYKCEDLPDGTFYIHTEFQKI